MLIHQVRRLVFDNLLIVSTVFNINKKNKSQKPPNSSLPKQIKVYLAMVENQELMDFEKK